MDDVCPEIRPVTEGALKSIHGTTSVKMRHFPFRLGRESRYRIVDGEVVSMERRLTQSNPNNELYVLDLNVVMNVSREHCQIVRLEDGRYKVVDRGSSCGTIVNGIEIGVRAETREASIESGARIVLGTKDSPFVFDFVIPADEDR
ncbi:MAG: FHA domain-containing protein [Verrucomicrobia bacterium]|nr:FHA domain-containing protein [Verrucomicrobiota bacterium]